MYNNFFLCEARTSNIRSMVSSGFLKIVFYFKIHKNKNQFKHALSLYQIRSQKLFEN